MRRWFLSYNSHDLSLTKSLKAALARKDPDATFFFAPESLRAGNFWLPTLAKEISDATSFVLVIGENGVGRWQTPEYYEAFDKRVNTPDFPVVLVLLDGQPAPGLEFLHQLHWIVTKDPASEQTIAKLMDAVAGGGERQGELWRHAAPYRGLAAMTETDSDYFFGRTRETVEVLKVLESAPHKLPILLGNSGVGKSSLAQAGVLASLSRQAWPARVENAGAWPRGFADSRRWCFIKLRPGTEPLKALVEPFLDTWRLGAANPERVKHQTGWIELLRDGTATLRDLLDATERRYEELQQPKPPAFFLYIDQGEELYVRAEEHQRRRFSEVIAQSLGDDRLHALMSMRSDFLGALQNDEPLFNACRRIDMPPLREAELREVVSRPAELLSARFETDRLAVDITQRAAAESARDTGALPLLSYLLDDMWTQMVKRGDGMLRLPAQSIDLGSVLVERADTFLANNAQFEDKLRRIFTLKLATVREDAEPSRRRAFRSEFTDEEWRLISELADHPYRLLITATPEVGETAMMPRAAATELKGTPAAGEPYAEVAHEAIFLRWGRLRDWIAAEREFLAWKTGLEAAHRAWQATPNDSKNDALLMGLALSNARMWRAKRAENLPKLDREFIDRSIEREQRTRRRRALAGVLFVGIISVVIGLAYGGWLSESYLKVRFSTLPDILWSKVLTASAESALRPKDTFKECTGCPEMVVAPAGDFIMGSPATELGHSADEEPQHKVTIAKPFAVSKFDVTFDEWDTCYELRECKVKPGDQGWGRGTRPVINVSWEDTQEYVAWLSKRTGKPYRLLSEAEWEYAARAGTTTAYWWGDEIGKGNANCKNCGSEWDGHQTSPVESFKSNAFGLYDMVGNVWQWVQDCRHDDYNGAPADGSAWSSGDCRRVVRGGSWNYDPHYLRSAYRSSGFFDARRYFLGFRVGRTLSP
jgi:formylglycine-generating enzyme required for sulfatase activity